MTFADGIALFRAFLQKEYAEENLDFVLKVTAYKECSPRKRQKMAWKLYKTYIAIGAPHELNLDILSRRVTDLAMITPHVSTFDSAQKRVFNLLENDAYRRFLQWDIYQQLAMPESSSAIEIMEEQHHHHQEQQQQQQQQAETRL